MVRKERYSYRVTIDRDPIPGWNSTPDDFKNYLQKHLEEVIGHYDPTVEHVGFFVFSKEE